MHLCEVPVASLPWPWNPFKCTWQDRFEGLVGGRKLGDPERTALFERMATALSPDEVGQCPYHVTDWRLAADLALSLNRLGNTPAHRTIENGVRARGGGNAEIEAVCSFWEEPMSWSEGAPVVGNGQHRVCALKLAGAEIALIDR